MVYNSDLNTNINVPPHDFLLKDRFDLTLDYAEGIFGAHTEEYALAGRFIPPSRSYHPRQLCICDMAFRNSGHTVHPISRNFILPIHYPASLYFQTHIPVLGDALVPGMTHGKQSRQ